MKSKVLCLALGMCVLFVLVGCGPSSPTPVGPTPTVVKPTCAGAALVVPFHSAPAPLSVIGSLTPTLSWTYPDAACAPEGFVLHIEMGPLYTPALGETLGNVYSWTPAASLQPGKVYRWWFSAVSGGTIGPQSTYRVFFTGPICTAAQMTAPVLFEPTNGSTVNNPSILIAKWDSIGGCIPTGYQLQLATDPAFTNIVETDDFPVAMNRAVWEDPNLFIDCTRYYWHVAQKVDDAVGPFSETWTYRVDLNGTCASEPPASVNGVVWNDDNQDSIRQAGESGRPGVVVNLGTGDCPSFVFTQTATTVADGSYAFNGLVPGKYCMEIDPLADISVGHFTLGVSGKEGRAYRAVEVGPGAMLTGQDFGWYQIPPVGAQIKLKINAFCHSGPALWFPSPAFGVTGMSYPIVGISPDMLWYYVQFNETQRCWFAKDTGDTSGALGSLPPGPTPVPTPITDCSKYSSQGTCEADVACRWVSAAVRTPNCTNK